MAITDQQLDNLLRFARRLGRHDAANRHPHRTEDEVLANVFDEAEAVSMRTEDEFYAIVTLDDLPDTRDHLAIFDSYGDGRREETG
jgi:hypothetical protein